MLIAIFTPACLSGHKCHDACSKTSAKLPKQTSDKISSVSPGALACFQRAPSKNPAFGPLRSRCRFLCRTASVYWRYGMSPNRLLVQRRRLAFLAREKHKKGREPGPLATSTSTKQRVARMIAAGIYAMRRLCHSVAEAAREQATSGADLLLFPQQRTS